MASSEVLHRQRIELALARCRIDCASYPGVLPFESAKEQLVFMLEFLLGRTSDVKLLSQINLGVLAAREFEDRDMTLAELVYEVEDTKSYLLRRGPTHAT